jgi:hypothetical protein
VRVARHSAGLPRAIEMATGRCCCSHRLRRRGRALHLEQKPTHLCTDSTMRQQRAHLWQADRLSCSVSEVDRQITIFTLAATPPACSAVMHSRHPDGQQP